MIASDASPLIALSRIGHLDLLPALYDRILIPPAVRDEVIRPGRSAPDLAGAAWLTVASPRDSAMVDRLRHVDRLDPREAEAIVLAGELNTRLILDERRGRRVAQARGVLVFGTVHVIVEAVRTAMISADEVESLLRHMVPDGFWLSERVIRLAVTQVREDA